MILGIDTATAAASAALVRDGQLVGEEVRSAPRRAGDFSSKARTNHAEILIPLIEAVLDKAGQSLSSVSGLALSLGPGSFTGLRIGLSTVKGLAYGCEIPVVGIPTLLAIAARAVDWDGVICPLLDARKKEVYAALFRTKAGSLGRLTEDMVLPPDKILSRIEFLNDRERCLFFGDGAMVYESLVKEALGKRAVLAEEGAFRSTAYAVARLAEEKFIQGEFDSLGTLAPLYLRPSQAELKRAQ